MIWLYDSSPFFLTQAQRKPTYPLTNANHFPLTNHQQTLNAKSANLAPIVEGRYSSHLNMHAPPNASFAHTLQVLFACSTKMHICLQLLYIIVVNAFKIKNQNRHIFIDLIVRHLKTTTTTTLYMDKMRLYPQTWDNWLKVYMERLILCAQVPVVT